MIVFLYVSFKLVDSKNHIDYNRNIYGGVIIYVREHIPSKEITAHTLPDDIEAIFIEINLRKSKWLLCEHIHPPNMDDSFYYFNNLSFCLDIYNRYDNFLLVDDFNTEACLKNFLQEHNAKSLVNGSICFKNVSTSCIGPFLTNNWGSFQNTTTYLNYVLVYLIFIKCVWQS